MSKENKQYAWAVVGAGPGGITAVGLLLDSGVSPEDILWLDPDFQAGDFGRLWGEVNSNTRVGLFMDYLHGIESFHYAKKSHSYVLDSLDKNGFTLLKHVGDALRFVSDTLCQKLHAKKMRVDSLVSKNGWQLNASNSIFFAKKVILAMGADAKSLNYPSISKIDLITALNPHTLALACTPDEGIAVFGSSHSAMIVIRHLVELGVKKIVNFYLSPLRYAVLMDNWILYDDTGLKGETATWVRTYLNQLPEITRYLSTTENIEQHLPSCQKAIYATGFTPRHIPVTGVHLNRYDTSNGIIAPGLFGLGIGFPITVTDPLGHKEANVGLWKFLKNMRRVLPIWEKYD